MKPLTFKLSSRQVALHWLVSLSFLVGAVAIYLALFWLPYQGLTLSGCPTSCNYPSDCKIPKCGTAVASTQTQVRGQSGIQIDRNKAQITCFRGKCQLAGGHKHFFGAALVFILILLGVLAGGIAYFKGSTRLTISDDGIHYHRIHDAIDIPWDSFLGITYHGVNTRLGRDATVYSISGDTGILSFLVPGLPRDTSTRELALGAFFFLKMSTEERDKLVEAIREKTGAEPESEYEW